MKIILILILGCIIPSITVFAQKGESSEANKVSPEEKKKQETPKAHVTVIALGAIAKRRYHIPEHIKKNKDGKEILEKGVAILIPPKEGESPPSTLYYRAKKDDENYQKIRIGFNNPASINQLEPNKEYRLYRRNEKSGDGYENYLTIPPILKNSQI